MYNKMPSTYTRAYFFIHDGEGKRDRKTVLEMYSGIDVPVNDILCQLYTERFIVENHIQSNTAINNLSFHAKARAVDVLCFSSSLHH